MRITIVLADEHDLVRKGLASLLRNQPDFDVVGECSNGSELLNLVADLRPDVVIVEVLMPQLSGVEAARSITTLSPWTRVIALSAYSDVTFIRAMLKAGCAGYLVKTGPASELFEAIRTARPGNPYFSREVSIASSSANAHSLESASNEGNHALSLREIETLQMIAEGHSAKEIALRMGISEATVKSHIKHLKAKLTIRDIPGLTRYAIKVGLIRV